MPPRSIACWHACRPQAADAGARLDQRGPGRVAPPATGAQAEQQDRASTASRCRSSRPVQEQGARAAQLVGRGDAGHRPAAGRAHGAVLAQPFHLLAAEGALSRRRCYRQNALFRREALGNFATLLKDVARDPAMLIYLDGMRTVARQPNENFARELLELFTLGEGHYSEADIKAAARAFTGWTIDRETGAFVRPARSSTTTARRPSSARPAASTATRSSPSCCGSRARPRPSSRSCGASSSR